MYYIVAMPSVISKRIILCLLALVLASAAYARLPKYLEITFLTTNDLHAYLVPFDIKGDPVKKTPDIKDVGGAARRATIIRTIRSEDRNPVLLLDSGDTTYGWSPLAKAFHGAPDMDMMNVIGYDAMVPGNHEFQLHSPDLLRNHAAAKFPWVCANVIYEKTGELFTQPYIIREAGGVRVAILGLTNDLVSTQPNTYKSGPELGLKYLSATEVAAKLVPELRQKADIIVLLSHLGVGGDQALAKAVPGIDIILGGHSHWRLNPPRMVSVGQPTAYWNGMVPVVQAGYFGMDLGRTRLIFHRDDSGKYTLMSCKGELIRINASIPDDPAISRLIEGWVKRIPPPAPPKPATPAPTAPAK